MEIWNEICFILTKNISSNASEQVYEPKVIRAFEKLGWSEYKKEISVRENIQIGASNSIEPDIIIKSDNKNLFVIEVKKPSSNLNNSSFQDQLFSYMRMLRLNFGILIGNEIKIFVDGSVVGSKKSELLETIELTNDNPKGLNFVNLFKKSDFNLKRIETYIQEKIENIKESKTISNLKKEITKTEYSEYLKNELKDKLLSKYSENITENVLKDFEIKIVDKTKPEISKTIYKQIPHRNKEKFNGNITEQELIKIHKKVPVWFFKPHQKNSQILINFLKLREIKTPVTIFELESACQNITNFKSSYQAMKTISDRNNAKVFDEVGHIITLWKPGKDFIEKEYGKFKRNNG